LVIIASCSQYAVCNQSFGKLWVSDFTGKIGRLPVVVWKDT